jgi:hypothetical protein
MAREEVQRTPSHVQIARTDMDPETTGSIRPGLRQTVGPEHFMADGLDSEATRRMIDALLTHDSRRVAGLRVSG